MRVSGYRKLMLTSIAAFLIWRNLFLVSSGPIPLLTLVKIENYWDLVTFGVFFAIALTVLDQIFTRGKEDSRSVLSTAADVMLAIMATFIATFTQGVPQ